MKYTKPEFDVTVYDFEDIIAVDAPSQVQVGGENQTEAGEDWWG